MVASGEILENIAFFKYLYRDSGKHIKDQTSWPQTAMPRREIHERICFV